MISHKLESVIRVVENFPRPGVFFRDLTPLFKQPQLCMEAIDEIVDQLGGRTIDAVVGVESRGFFLAPSIAFRLGVTFVPARKKGKLPFTTIGEPYELEYGQDWLEIHADAIRQGDRVLVHDDVLATGGTAGAAARLVERAGGVVVAFAFILELAELKGRDKLKSYHIISLKTYN